MLAVAFLFPAVLGAAGAAALPVIIHLILRTKPRWIVFPAMRFVRKTHQANLSKLRLKHVLLLLMRMAAIVLLAVLIARAELPRWTAVQDRDVPAAAVVIVDNSGSMRYVHQGRTLLSRGQRFAQRVLDALPPGSRVAVLPTEGAAEKLSLQADRKFAAEQLAAVQPGYGTRPVSAALARALAMLEKADLARKEVYIVSDMTAQSWRELRKLPEGDVQFIVLNCGGGEDANISLGDLKLGGTSVPEGAQVVVETVLRSAQVGGEVDVRAELNGRATESQSVVLQAGAAAAVTLTFPAPQRGLAHGRVFFEQSDPLAMDNVRYFTLHVGPPAKALLVRDAATVGRGDATSFLMGHAIAPAAAGATAGWIQRETITADRLGGAQLGAVQIVLLSDVSSLSEGQWKALEDYVRGGGHLWIVIGSLLSSASYNSAAAQRILPAALGELEILPKRIGWRAERRSEPVLAPFATGENPPLSQVRCERRFRLASVASDAHVILRYADGKAAIVMRPAGEGSVVLWNFSPVREFSNLANLAQFPILAQRTARLLVSGAESETLWLWGRSATVGIPKSMAGAMMTVRKPGQGGETPVVHAPSQRVLSFHADRLGHWTVQFAEGDRRVLRGFSVNTDFAESDLTPAGEADLKAAFGADRLLVASSTDDLAERRRTVRQPLDLSVPILLALLVLMTGESFFANRFYRTDQSPGPAQ
jgi:hypothetical protein